MVGVGVGVVEEVRVEVMVVMGLEGKLSIYCRFVVLVLYVGCDNLFVIGFLYYFFLVRVVLYKVRFVEEK